MNVSICLLSPDPGSYLFIPLADGSVNSVPALERAVKLGSKLPERLNQSIQTLVTIWPLFTLSKHCLIVGREEKSISNSAVILFPWPRPRQTREQWFSHNRPPMKELASVYINEKAIPIEICGCWLQ